MKVLLRSLLCALATTALVALPLGAQRTSGLQCSIDPSHVLSCSSDSECSAAWRQHLCSAHGQCGGGGGDTYTGPANPSFRAFGKNMGNLLTGGLFRRRSRSSPRPSAPPPQTAPEPSYEPSTSTPTYTAPTYTPPRDDELARSVRARRSTSAASSAPRDEELARSIRARRSSSSPAAATRTSADDELARRVRAKRGTRANADRRGEAYEWARSAAAAGGRARNANEAGRAPAGEVFDTPGRRERGEDPSVPPVPVGPRQPERVPPALARDPRYLELQTRRRELQQQRQGLERELAQVRAERDAGRGDVGALQVSEARIRQRISGNEAQQNQVEYQRREMTRIANRGVNFDGGTTGTPAQNPSGSQQSPRNPPPQGQRTRSPSGTP